MLGPYSKKDSEQEDHSCQQLLFDLSEATKFARGNGFCLEGLYLIDSEKDAAFLKLFKSMLSRGGQEFNSTGFGKDGKMALVLLSRDMAIVRLQMCRTKLRVKPMKQVGAGTASQAPGSWIPKTKEECSAIFEALG